MRKVFYKDSFRVLIRLTDCAGHAVAPPSCEWSARIYTPGATRFVSIGYSAGERRGWTPEGDAIAVAVDNHGLRPGPLLADFQFCLPSDAMPDGCQELQRSYDLELRLSERQECCMPSAAEATLLLPFIKGSDMTWDGMTEEERRALTDEVADAVRGSVGAVSGEALTSEEARSMVDEIFQ